MSVSVAMETLLYRAAVEMQQSEGGKREVGGEGERNVGKHRRGNQSQTAAMR